MILEKSPACVCHRNCHSLSVTVIFRIILVLMLKIHNER